MTRRWAIGTLEECSHYRAVRFHGNVTNGVIPLAHQVAHLLAAGNCRTCTWASGEIADATLIIGHFAPFHGAACGLIHMSANRSNSGTNKSEHSDYENYHSCQNSELFHGFLCEAIISIPWESSMSNGTASRVHGRRNCY